jgi:hypothetical protein
MSAEQSRVESYRADVVTAVRQAGEQAAQMERTAT